MHTCNSSYSRSRGRRVTNSRPAQAKIARPYLKSKNIKKKKRER
jgi:hypothetical protein